MPSRRFRIVVAASALAVASFAVHAQNAAVPRDLKPLLAKPGSELRLVVTRYNADRQTLNANYAGPAGFNTPRGRGGPAGGPGGGPGARGDRVELSAARLARLKRFDLDWQAALATVPTATLSPAARSDLDALQKSLADNMADVEADHLQLEQISPALPFAPALVALIEARIRVDDVQPEEAARALTDVKGRIAAAMAAPPVRMNATTAGDAATATDTLRAAIGEWFSFYDAYDPMFTWWMGMPYKQVDQALQDYAAFLRDKVADANTPVSPTSIAPVQPAAPPEFASVPDLNEIIALPQDELRDIVARFNADGRGGRGGRGGAGK